MKVIVLILSILLAFPVAKMNYTLFDKAKYAETEGVVINQHLLEQLAFLEDEMHGGAALNMQNSYPEGHLFMNALYGLSWCEVAKVMPSESELYQKAHLEIDFALKSINSKGSTKRFADVKSIPHGIFFTGWRNYLAGHQLAATEPDHRDSIMINTFTYECDLIAKAIQESNTPFLESYNGAAWPADMCSAVASLAVHDKLFKPKYEAIIDQWLQKCDSLLDRHGLIAHSVDHVSGTALESAMGSSQSLILSFLHEIDHEYGEKMFAIYREKFLVKRLGLPGVKEYPKGEKGPDHVDAGPIVWGIGGAASIVGIRACYLYGQQGTAKGIRNCVNFFALEKEKKGKRYYLFGKWPMADAFIAWSNSLEITPDREMTSKKRWRTSFQLGSLAFIGLLSYWNIRRWKR